MRTGAHVGIGHARQRHVGKGFTAAVARGARAHQTCIELVLHVATQNAVLDQRGAAGRRAFIVDVQRAAPARQRAVIDDGAGFGGHALADAIRKGRGALAIEIALESMADGLVQQHAGPARPEHDGHGASGRTSAASSPSLLATSTTSWTAVTLAMTCITRGSSARVSRSTRISQATLSASLSAVRGSSGRYS